MIDEQKLLEEGVLIFPKPEGGCVVFSAAELSCIDTSADSTQPVTLVWLRGASQPILVARTGDEVLDHFVKASAALDKKTSAEQEKTLLRYATHLTAMQLARVNLQ